MKKFRQLTEEVAALTRQFNGSFAAEHGVGIGRTEFLKEQVGDDMYLLMRQIKKSFNPHNLLNPGKIVSDGRYKLDTNLRQGAGHALKLPFEPVLAFAGRDESFIRNLEQCNGCGSCLKLAPTMCPTYIATGEEIMSTRGRANAIRAVLELRGIKGEPLRSAELKVALNNCLSCKACAVECPSNVNLSLLKAELQYARIRRHGLSLRERLFSSVDWFGRMGCKTPRLANAMIDSFLVRALLARIAGLSPERRLPRYAKVRFDQWFAERLLGKRGPIRGRVILWDDTFVRYHEPQIGIAAVKVLEAAGFEVTLPVGRECCGRPAFSQGNLAEVMRLGRHNLELLSASGDTPILFLEPSCYSMFAQDYRELNLPGAELVAARCFLLAEFLDNLLKQEPNLLRFNVEDENVVIHAHCHAKALSDSSSMHRLVMRLPNRKVNFLDTGCCGMAGAFGMLEAKLELSLEMAKPLMEKIRAQPYGTVIVASGFSCRQQIEHLAPVRPRHIAEVLAGALE